VARHYPRKESQWHDTTQESSHSGTTLPKKGVTVARQHEGELCTNMCSVV
jgi:hypothetical protein